MDVWPDRGRRAASLPAEGGSLGVYGRGELGVSGRAGGRALPGRLGVSVGFRGRSANAVSAMEEEARVRREMCQVDVIVVVVVVVVDVKKTEEWYVQKIQRQGEEGVRTRRRRWHLTTDYS